MRSSNSSGADTTGFVFLLLYLVITFIVCVTITVFPGRGLNDLFGMDAIQKTFISDFAKWTTLDWIRVVTVAWIHYLPISAWFKAQGVTSDLLQEERYAKSVTAQLNHMISGRTFATLKSLTEQDFRKLFNDKGLGPDKNLLASNLLDEVISKAMQRRIEPTSVLVDPYRAELYGVLSRISPLQRYSLQLGILFTFVGLAAAFSVAQFGTTVNDANDDIGGLLTALSLAFGTSVAGLVSSIAIMLMASALRRRLSTTVRAFEVLVDRTYTFGRQAPTAPQFLDQVSEVAKEVGNVNERIAASVESNNRLSDTISGGVDKLAKTKSDFDAMLNYFGNAQARLLEGMQAYVRELEPDKMRKQLDMAADVQLQAFSRELTASTTTFEAIRKQALQQQEMIDRLIALQSNSAASIEEIRVLARRIEKDVSNLHRRETGRGGFFGLLGGRRKEAALPEPRSDRVRPE